MKKVLALFVLFSVLIYSYSNSYIDVEHDVPLVIHEYEPVSFSALGDLQPADGDLKQKGISIVHVLPITLLLLITFSSHCLIQFIRRLTTLCPVFFQSNYLITSPGNLNFYSIFGGGIKDDVGSYYYDRILFFYSGDINFLSRHRNIQSLYGVFS